VAPLICLIVSFISFRALGFVVAYFSDWQHSLQAALGAMFLLTASAHWGRRRPDLIAMVPLSMGRADVWVTLTGVAEVALSIGLQIPRVAPYAASCGVVMLCCLFPANRKAAREHLTILKKPVLAGWPRLGLQVVFIVLLLASVWRRW
jgi:uncharacterized membrane protein